MAVRDDFTAGEVLAAADLNDTFASKPPFAYGTATPTTTVEGFIWYDENDTPPEPKFWDGAAFQTFGGGKILQVVTAAKTDTFTLSSATFTDITGLSVTTAALSSTSSRVKITVSLGRVAINSAVAASVGFRLMRDSTAIGIGDAAGNRTRSTFLVVAVPVAANDNYSPGGYSFTFVDSPSTVSATTYKLQMATEPGATGYINRSYLDSNPSAVYNTRTASTITIEEISI